MQVTKKNGNVVLFDDEKVVTSILKANAEAPEEELSRRAVELLANEVFDRLTDRSEIITTKEVRACVAEVLKEKGKPVTAERYLAYKK